MLRKMRNMHGVIDVSKLKEVIDSKTSQFRESREYVS